MMSSHHVSPSSPARGDEGADQEAATFLLAFTREVEHPFWRTAPLWSGATVKLRAVARGYTPIAAWGADGYPLGDWPAEIVYERRTPAGDDAAGGGEEIELVRYREGEGVRRYVCHSEAIRRVLLTCLAWAIWRRTGLPAALAAPSFRDLPDDLAVPYDDGAAPSCQYLQVTKKHLTFLRGAGILRSRKGAKG